jgi:hypothetical protein
MNAYGRIVGDFPQEEIPQGWENHCFWYVMCYLLRPTHVIDNSVNLRMRVLKFMGLNTDGLLTDMADDRHMKAVSALFGVTIYAIDIAQGLISRYGNFDTFIVVRGDADHYIPMEPCDDFLDKVANAFQIEVELAPYDAMVQQEIVRVRQVADVELDTNSPDYREWLNSGCVCDYDEWKKL